MGAELHLETLGSQSYEPAKFDCLVRRWIHLTRMRRTGRNNTICPEDIAPVAATLEIDGLKLGEDSLAFSRQRRYHHKKLPYHGKAYRLKWKSLQFLSPQDTHPKRCIEPSAAHSYA